MFVEFKLLKCDLIFLMLKLLQVEMKMIMVVVNDNVLKFKENK